MPLVFVVFDFISWNMFNIFVELLHCAWQVKKWISRFSKKNSQWSFISGYIRTWITSFDLLPLTESYKVPQSFWLVTCRLALFLFLVFVSFFLKSHWKLGGVFFLVQNHRTRWWATCLCVQSFVDICCCWSICYRYIYWLLFRSEI